MLFGSGRVRSRTNMAACSRTAWKVVAGCGRRLLEGGSPTYASFPAGCLPARSLAAAAAAAPAFKPRKKGKKEEAEPKVKKEPRVINDEGRHKPYGRTAWAPVDDVYILRYYPRIVHSASDAVDLLKKYQVLDFTAHNQPVYVDLKLDMQLEKKKKISPFVSTVHLPHPFKTETSKVVVFTEDPHQATVAKEGGAAFVGGAELIQPILDEEVVADFYVAVPEMLAKLVPLKNKLRKKFPKSNRGSVGVDITKMLERFRTGHEYAVESECYVRTQIATLDFPKEHILANLQTVLLDVCSHRPADTGVLVQRAIMASHSSEALWFNSEELLATSGDE
ncbi:large ribosomal subunit protein uL1m [Nerophis lumbriciformis]|uniref:large ribosomal subunit protein uL1m n=1 Tax=Nerophis lumbriciformis TaxID=546530 RepID=UPI002ADF0406|nr:large ribosomal subunit protein uL1m-like [Nerophis lumbriciformis]